MTDSREVLGTCEDSQNPHMKADCENWKPVELLADVMHLWVDGYISKNPNSSADDSISSDMFEKILRFLCTQGIEVDYCGWHRTSPTTLSPEKIAAPDTEIELPPLDVTEWDEQTGHTILRDSLCSGAFDSCISTFDRLACRERQLLSALTQLREAQAKIARLETLLREK